MLKRLILFAFFLIASPAGAQGDLTARLGRAYSVIDSAMTALPPGPGLVVGITDRGRMLRVFTHGYADVKRKTPVTANSLFAIGSISKSFTAIALMQLADEGRFDPRVPLTTYLPWFQIRSSFEPITGHHVLSHTAGLPNYRADLASVAYASYDLRDFQISYAPGVHYWYSNLGFQTLGYVLEAIEGAPYRTIIPRRIFEKVGMSSSLPLLTGAARLKLPVSYARASCDTALVEQPWFEYRAADGSIVSTVEDMLAYTRVLLNKGATARGRLLSERAFATLTTPVTGAYAYGLGVRTVGGDTVIAHGGAIAGFRAGMSAHVSDGFGIVWLSNGTALPDGPTWIENVVQAAVRGKPLPGAPAPPASVDQSAILARLSGDYYSAADTRMSFVATDDALSLIRDGRTIPLRRIGPASFCSSDPEFATFPFAFETRGDTVLGVSSGPDVFSAAAYPRPPRVDIPAEYLPLIGRYENHNPEGGPIRIFVRSGKLYSARGSGPGTLLVRVTANEFRYEAQFNPERIRFDPIVAGHALRLLYSGMPMYRVDER